MANGRNARGSLQAVAYRSRDSAAVAKHTCCALQLFVIEQPSMRRCLTDDLRGTPCPLQLHWYHIAGLDCKGWSHLTPTAALVALHLTILFLLLVLQECLGTPMGLGYTAVRLYLKPCEKSAAVRLTQTIALRIGTRAQEHAHAHGRAPKRRADGFSAAAT